MDSQLDVHLPEETQQWERMKEDWNQRAVENARWYINTARLDQTEEEFHQTGLREIDIWILPELELLTQGRDPKTLQFLEIGCGIGRMTRPLAGIFGHVYGTDVSGEMIRQARERLADLPNVSLWETSGGDVGPIPDESIDIAYSIFVFQHVPSRAAIRATLLDAWRALRPGGLLRFQTNGVTADSFIQSEKNTWIGVSFSEAEVRALARELGAQLVSLYGAETMYCFSTLRKPLEGSGRPAVDALPVIEAVACTNRPDSPAVPLGGPDACLSLLVSGIEREALDANRWALRMGTMRAPFRYAGPIRPHFQAAATALSRRPLDELAYFESPIPEGLVAEQTPVQLLLDDQPIGKPASVLLVGLPLRAAKIVSVRNLVDFGTDVHVAGPKSRFTVFLEGLDESISPATFRLRIGGQDLLPDHAGFEAVVASYLLNAALPAGLSPGPALLEVFADGVETIPLEVDILP